MTKVATPKTREEMEDLVRRICSAEIRVEELKNTMDAEVLRVRSLYQDDITSVSGELKEMLEAAEKWALEHQDEFASKKSIAMVHGTVLYRTGTPKLKTLRGVTWAKVLGVIKAAFPEYLRVSEEVAKDQILADRDRLGRERLTRMGVEVVQEESFAVVPHRSEVQA